MKLNSKIIYQLLIIILLSSYHFFIHNGLEKLFNQTYFDHNNVRRPLARCDKEINCSKLKFFITNPVKIF